MNYEHKHKSKKKHSFKDDLLCHLEGFVFLTCTVVLYYFYVVAIFQRIALFSFMYS